MHSLRNNHKYVVFVHNMHKPQSYTTPSTEYNELGFFYRDGRALTLNTGVAII